MISSPFKHAVKYMGGGGGGAAQAVAAAPAPTPAPPVTSASSEVIQASQDQARQDMMKKSIKKTIFAGDTGGFKAPAAAAKNLYGAAPKTPGAAPYGA